MKNAENFFLIAGSGRNVGKTTFCCKLIERFSKENRITALKITDHFHDLEGQSVRYLHKGVDFVIVEEIDDASEKDTARFLKAGADSSFLIMAKHENLEKALDKLDTIISLEKNPVIAESGYLFEIMRPGLAGFVTDKPEIKINTGFDFVAHPVGEGDFDVDIEEFSVYGVKWVYN